MTKHSFWPFPVHAAHKEACRRIAQAVRANDPQAVAEAVALGSPVNFLVLSSNRSLLGSALKAKRYAAAEALLAAGASPLYPWDWRQANSTDSMAKEGTVVTQANTAVETVVETANWPWVERFFKDSSLDWKKMEGMAFNTFSQAVYQGAPERVMDVMLERSRHAQLQRPSDGELLDYALLTGSPVTVEHMALRCQKPGVSANPHVLTPHVSDPSAWATSIQSFLTSQDPEYPPNGTARAPLGRGLVQLVTMWLSEGGERSRLVEWVGLAAKRGMGQALSKSLLPACPRPLKAADLERWVKQTLDAPSRANDVWKALDNNLGEAEVNRHLERLAGSGRLWPMLATRLKSPVGIGSSVLKSVERLGRANLQLPKGFMEELVAWRGTGLVGGPIKLLVDPFGPPFLDAMVNLGWSPSSSAVAWDELLDASHSSQARAWFRALKLEHSLDESAQSRRGPRL